MSGPGAALNLALLLVGLLTIKKTAFVYHVMVNSAPIDSYANFAGNIFTFEMMF